MAEFKTITRDQLRNWINENKDFTLIDVLSEKSYETRHLPGAKHADVGDKDFLKKAETLVPDKDTPVVVYCGSFKCGASPKAADKLARAGFTEVHAFRGGLVDWEDAGYPLEKNGQLIYE